MGWLIGIGLVVVAVAVLFLLGYCGGGIFDDGLDDMFGLEEEGEEPEGVGEETSS